MNQFIKGLIRFLVEVAVITVLLVGIKIFTDGMYLSGLPALEEIRTVTLSYPAVADEAKEVSGSEDIELALKLTGFLKYDLFEKANSAEEPLITITYHLADGTDQAISANHTTVWWNGKIYALKEKEMFITLAEGIFFSEALQAK